LVRAETRATCGSLRSTLRTDQMAGKVKGGGVHLRLHEGVCRGRIACELPSLTGASLDMEKIGVVAPGVAAEIRHGDRLPLDIGSFKANVYKSSGHLGQMTRRDGDA
jgi:hypothetical protein